MTHHRTELRAAARALLAGVHRFRNFTAIPAWSQSVDSESLPVFCVMISRETAQAIDYSSHERRLELHVIVKRMGGDDIEDAIDLDAEAVEITLLPYLRATYLHAELAQTEIEIAGEGRQRVGSVQITFGVMLHTNMPA